MSMVKLVSPHGWDFQERIVTPVKISSRGLVGADRAEFMKTASHAFLPQLDCVKFAKDEVPVHLIALGASEAYGPNRNGDGFKEAACRKYHDTFVKFAKFYRNHRNKAERGDPFYGVVKASAYNEDMKRVELLCALNAEKSAAERNGGFVADSELEKLARGDDIPVSMACHVSHDVCSFCHNSARNRSEYCTQEKCAAGGCRSNLTRLVKVAGDLHHLHVDNPHPRWFDISSVFRPADRIAYGAKADYLTKSASDAYWFEMQDYIKAAEAAVAPLEVLLDTAGCPGEFTQKQISQIKLGYALANLEGQRGQEYEYREVASADFPIEKLAAWGSSTCLNQLAALADRKVFLSLKDYARLTDREAYLKEASTVQPEMFTRLAEEDVLPRLVEAGACQLADEVKTEKSAELAVWLAPEFSMEKSAAENRAYRSCFRMQPPPRFARKAAASAVSPEADQLVRDYAMYKLAALWRAAGSDPDFPLTVRRSLRQNQVL